jgi:hypothetical protein
MIGDLCSPMLVEEPSAEDYLCWLSEEVSSLLDVFNGVNGNFAAAAIEGALAMDGDSIDFDAVRVAASESSIDVLPTGPDVRRAARSISKKWWPSFGYNYVLSIIRAKKAEVLAYFYLLLS